MGVGDIYDAIALVNTISHLSMLTAVLWSMFLVELYVSFCIFRKM